MLLLQVDAEKICMRIKAAPKGQSSLKPCCLCGGSTSFKVLTDEPESVKDSFSYSNLNLATRDNVNILHKLILVILNSNIYASTLILCLIFVPCSLACGVASISFSAWSSFSEVFVCAPFTSIPGWLLLGVYRYWVIAQICGFSAHPHVLSLLRTTVFRMPTVTTWYILFIAPQPID